VADDGNTMLPHCKSALTNADHFTPEEGFCYGTIETLALQLPLFFEVSALSGGLVSPTPE
jgi:hypothetical protein